MIFTCEKDMMMVMRRSRHGFEWQQTVDVKQHFAISRLPFQMYTSKRVISQVGILIREAVMNYA